MSRKIKLSIEEKTLNKNWNKYKGYTVLVIGDKVFASKKPAQVKKYFDSIIKKYNKSPLITVIPKADTMILITL